MAKIITGDVHTYVKQLISEALSFKDITDSVPENSRTSENSRNYPPKEGQQVHTGCFQSSGNERREK